MRKDPFTVESVILGVLVPKNTGLASLGGQVRRQDSPVVSAQAPASRFLSRLSLMLVCDVEL